MRENLVRYTDVNYPIRKALDALEYGLGSCFAFGQKHYQIDRAVFDTPDRYYQGRPYIPRTKIIFPPEGPEG